MPAISIRNVGVYLTITLILKNTFLKCVDRVIVIFVVYSVFVGICYISVAKATTTALISLTSIPLFKFLPLNIKQKYNLFKIA